MAGTVQHLGGEDKKRDRCLPRCQLIIGCVFSATVGQAAEGIEWNVRNNQDVEVFYGARGEQTREHAGLGQ